jgi:hypothetical protein
MVLDSDLQLTPRIHHASAIRADPTLAASLRAFVNEGYRYMSPANKERWDPDLSDRLSSIDSVHQALGDDGLFAVIYDPNMGRPEEGETGWEIKTVSTHVDWMKKGLAGQCVDALIDELARLEKYKLRGESLGNKRTLNIWIQAVECLNGAFWLKRGGKLVRSHDKPPGHWGSKYGYRLLVLLREIDIDERC